MKSMKKILIFALSAASIGLLAGCNNASPIELESATYEMQTGSAENEYLTPCIEIDTDGQTFILSYDATSSYLPTGTYEIKDDQLIATTDDELYQYYFTIQDSDTLVFDAEKSASVELIDEAIGVPMEDGSEFVVSQ